MIGVVNSWLLYTHVNKDKKGVTYCNYLCLLMEALMKVGGHLYHKHKCQAANSPFKPSPTRLAFALTCTQLSLTPGTCCVSPQKCFPPNFHHHSMLMANKQKDVNLTSKLVDFITFVALNTSMLCLVEFVEFILHIPFIFIFFYQSLKN
jgi:hypothetical protein